MAGPSAYCILMAAHSAECAGWWGSRLHAAGLADADPGLEALKSSTTPAPVTRAETMDANTHYGLAV